ncbi:MAG: ABC transporter ATP-binding protein [Gemmatimonadota bacterium]
MESDVAISTRDLTKTYRSVEALSGLNLEVRRNSIFGFLGPNGAGKTTTIKLLLGLVRPTRGNATLFGMDLAHDSLSIRRRIGYLAQDPRYYDYMTARQTVRFTAGFFYSGPHREVERKISEVLDLVGLADKADRAIRGFSGGERQRLGIAQAQINSPDLLILDEPAASLDPMGRRDVLEIMGRLRERTTVFYSTHILEDVQRVSDTVAILNLGRLVAQAPIGELLTGSGHTIYDIELRGAPASAAAELRTRPWILAVKEASTNGAAVWQVTVTDDAAAEAQLLRAILADPAVEVVRFGRKRFQLEEVFMNLIEGAAA